MNKVHELLTTLANLNVKLWVDEDRLRLSAPTGVLTYELQEQLRLQKGEILSLFAQKNGKVKAAAIPVAARCNPIPLSFAQQRLWFLAQLEGPSATYNLPSAFRLQGELSLPALQRALDQVVARHESLRTTFIVSDATPEQIISPARAVLIEDCDFSALAADEQTAAVQRLIDEDAQTHFDLTLGPLLRVRLAKLDTKEHVLSLTLHHIISDGWSAGIFMQEFCTCYRQELVGKSAHLPPLSIQYADYAIWQQQQPLDHQLEYWRNHLEGAPPLLELPTDRPRLAQQHFVGDQWTVALDSVLSRKLEQLARQHNATLHMTLLAAFALLLSRYSGAKDIVIGTPVANRNRPELEPLIGFFVNTLALRFDLHNNPTFSELLQRVRQTALDGYAHQEAPFEQVVELLQPQRQLSHTPLFQAVFNLMTLPSTQFSLPGLTFSPLEGTNRSAKFDLALSIGQGETEVQGTWEYNSDLFDRSTVERMAHHWQQILKTVAWDPNQPISEISLFEEHELSQLLAQCQGVECPLPATLTIQQLFEQQAAKTPDAPALLFGESTVTYRQLNERANQLAHFLQNFGSRPGSFVGLCSERSPAMVIGILGILKSGAAYLPLDPDLPRDRLQFIVEDAHIQFALASSATVAKIDSVGLPYINLDTDWQQIVAMPSYDPPSSRLVNMPIYVIYTSGSTGQPKGVIVGQRGVVNTIVAMIQETKVTVGDRLLQFVPFSFDASAMEFFCALCSGASLVLHPNPTQLGSLELLRLCESQQISVVNFTVALWQQWVDDLSAQGLRFPTSLRLFLTGGEKPSLDPLKRWASLGDHHMRFICSYGPTEASITSTLYTIDNQQVRTSPPSLIPLGHRLPNTSLYLLDEHQQLVPSGVIGEIYLGGAGLAHGYLKREALTKERFVELADATWGVCQTETGASPFTAPVRHPVGRLYRTGDLARRRADGSVEFVGRRDSQVKVRGFRVELGEIEALIKAYPTVSEALVLAVDFTSENQHTNDKRLVAYLQPSTLDLGALKSFLQSRLPAHMIPVAFVLLQHFPLTHNGKLDRKTLPRPDFQADRQAFVAPQSELEQQLAAIWAEVLGVKRISMTSNFFELGGHSLLATQVISRIRQQLKVEVPLRILFEEPTLMALAVHVAKQHNTPQRPPIQAVKRTGNLPLSFAQQRLWLLQQLNPESGFFNMPLAFHLQGTLDVAALRASFCEIVRRHEILRTTFPSLAGEPIQQIAPATNELLAFSQIDLQVLDGAHHEQVVSMMAEDEAAKPFDLATGPLLRIKLLRRSAVEHVLLLTMHHIVGDDWSNVLLMQELRAIYNAFARGEISPLPELSLQYGDFAHWQRSWLQGPQLSDQLDYWRKHLADAPPLLQLPLDRPRPAQQRYVGNTINADLSLPVLHKLHELSRQQQATPHMVLFAAFSTLLARYSGMDDLVIGVPVANRTHAQVEPLVGCFLNTLALRLKFHNQPSFLELLHQVKQVTTRGYENQDLPIEEVIKATAAKPQLSHSPLFQVMFNYLQDHQQQLQIPGLSISPLAVENHTAKFDLTLTATAGEKNLTLSWEYNSDLFEAATIQRMACHFEQLLEAALADPAIPVSILPLLNMQEREQLLTDWNRTNAAIPEGAVMHQLFEQQVERTPDVIAASCGGELISYRRLNERANRWAHALREKGVEADFVVAILAPRNIDFLSAILAIFKAGGAYLPIDPKTPAARIQSILRQSQTKLVISCATLQPLLDATLETLLVEERPNRLMIEELQRVRASASNLPVHCSPNHLAYVIFTSGSTGVPKGAMVEQRGLVNHLFAMQRNLQLGASDVIAQSATQSYVISVWQFLAALIVGCQVEIVPEEVAMEPVRLLRTIGERKITVQQIVPSLLRAMLPEIARAPHLLTSLRWLIPTGEALPPTLVRDWFAICPQIPLINAYGSSECSDDVAHDLISEAPSEEIVNMPAGRPIGNVRMLVLDSQLQPVPIGVEGELYVAGACVGRGYLHDPERTASVFLRDPFNSQPDARLYKTGDRARWLVNGKVEYLGRRDFQVKIRGFRIELGEIEATLAKHPSVKQAVVIVREEPSGNPQLVAYVVEKEVETERLDVRNWENSPSAPLMPRPSDLALTLRSYVADHLPEYMVPVAIVLLDHMPLNANGKLDRLTLPNFTQIVNIEASAYVAPRHAVELQLVKILANVLGVEEERLGVRHSFFDLGGHSLRAVQLLAQMRDSFGIELPLRQLFEHSTVEALADMVLDQQLAALDENVLLPLLEQAEKMTDEGLTG
ncbi:MAG: amino acid adenylation domain-containing protein [Caldilineaceae bacterium]